MNIPRKIASSLRKAEKLEKQRQRHPQASIPLIQLYEQIIDQLEPAWNPAFYAEVWVQLGNVYCELLIGEPATNVARAIECYQEALRFQTLEIDPRAYASTLNNLGSAYSYLLVGNPTLSQEQAILCYQEALRFQTPEDAPLEYATTQNNLGNSYMKMPTGDQAANVLRAIQCYQEALRFQTPEEAPMDYAMTRNNLGGAYLALPTGDRTINLEQAIECYQEALRFYRPEVAPLDYAMAQGNLGEAYRDLPTGDRARNLARAIECNQEALRFFTPETDPLSYARTQNNLGNAYRDLPTGDRARNLARAIECYQQTLRFFTPEADPLKWAQTQSNLGNIYREMPTRDRAKNLTRAIECYQQALSISTPEDDPLAYAMAQNNLGNVYYELPTGDRATNLARGIECFQQALRFYTPEVVPLKWATLQNNLGAIYVYLPVGDRAANLSLAIECFRQALRFRTPETDPLAYATTQNNLGIAFSDLPTGKRMDNLEQAIEHYQQALRFRTAEAAPLEYAATQNNLGNVYRDLPTGDRGHYLTQAIECFQEALRFFTLEADPLKWAMTQSNLGSAYRSLPIGDQASNRAQAIKCFQQALRFITPEVAPLEYATAQTNLGITYQDLPTGDRAANRAVAIECFQEALRFYTPEADPFECRRTAHYLADLYFDQGVWNKALQVYRVAIEIGEQLYQAGLSMQSKTAEASENAALYPNAAFAAVRCGETARAFLILEQGKTRLLTEALHLRVRRPDRVRDEIWKAFVLAGIAVRTEQAKKTFADAEAHSPVQAYEAHIQTTHAANIALTTAIERVRTYAPHFLAPMDLSALESQIADKHTALIAFSFTEQGTIGFIASQQDQEPVRVIELPTFTRTDLRQLFIEQDASGQLTGGWLGAYERYLVDNTMTSLETWKGTITRVLAKLSECLITPVLFTLSADIKRIIFLPSAELFLVPMQAIPFSGDPSRLLCDDYQVSYAPSIEVLAEARAMVRQKVEPELYAVINPQNDLRLAFTPIEGDAIARLFTHCIIDAGRVGTKERVLARAQGRTYVHFSCHGSYHWSDPPASGLNLADGRLTLADLQQGKIDLSTTRLVTLSACETGITDILQGSPAEYLGIPAGFLLIGVPCVVSSLWSVPDLSTALLMERFYHYHLIEQMDITAALQKAQIWVRERSIGEVATYVTQWAQQSTQKGKGKEELLKQTERYQLLARQKPLLRPFAHPHYWAAFTVNGI